LNNEAAEQMRLSALERLRGEKCACAARHTAATAMHLAGVPLALTAGWIDHKDGSLTMRLYAHSQDDALKAAGDTFNRVVTTS
jgi:integrase